MSSINHNQAVGIIATALAHATELGLHPLTVAVLDSGGVLVALQRQDRSSLLRPEIAIGKAWGCLGMGFGGRELQRRAEHSAGFFRAITELSNGRMVPVPGGVLVRDVDNAIIGAVGISGDTSENDEACAVAGIRSVGLVPDTGNPEG